ncbi:MAG: ABC transporter permease subunit [Burkholderiales bacterium]|nr:ABC transporter permease subunit [Burkholderiales bacterium]
MDFNLLLSQVPQLISGISMTLGLMFFALVMGLLLALILTIISYSRIRIISMIIYLYTFIIRGSPLLVQIFIIYYGSGQFDFIENSFLWDILKHPFWCAVIALSINSSAYCVVLFRGTINSIPKGEFEACKALGMSRIQMITRVIAGRFIRRVLPAYSNEVVIVLKSTSLASTITIMDLMGVTHEFISDTYATIPYLLIAGICYLLINMIIIRLFRVLENSMHVLG